MMIPEIKTDSTNLKKDNFIGKGTNFVSLIPIRHLLFQIKLSFIELGVTLFYWIIYALLL